MNMKMGNFFLNESPTTYRPTRRFREPCKLLTIFKYRSVVDMYGLNWDNVHVIGASLGAHAAGYFGR